MLHFKESQATVLENLSPRALFILGVQSEWTDFYGN